MNPIGILQGRLVPSETGELQCFPNSNWEKEFELAKSCRIDSIELIFDKEKNESNPLWTDAGVKRISKLSQKHSVKTASICADYFMSRSIFETKLAQFKEISRMFEFIVDCAVRLDAKLVVIPCFESSEIKDGTHKKNLITNLNSFVPILRDKKIQVALETTLTGSELKELVDQINQPSIGVCYDTGNTTAFGHDIENDIKQLAHRIVHVHIKDRKRNKGPNVFLGTGDADLKGAFRALKEINYKGYFVLETVRGDDPLKTARQHAEFIRQHTLN